MRVISGSARGKKLNSPADYSVRPTLDRVKESIFNMIAFFCTEARVLDLFAGSGALGIEALSRGAKEAVFVDNSDASLSVVRENVALTSFADKSQYYLSDFDTYLNKCDLQFDLIFLDPPYADGHLNEAIKIIHQRNLLADGGYIVCETDSNPAFVPDETLFKVYRNKHYGRVHVLLLTNL